MGHKQTLKLQKKHTCTLLSTSQSFLHSTWMTQHKHKWSISVNVQGCTEIRGWPFVVNRFWLKIPVKWLHWGCKSLFSLTKFYGKALLFLTSTFQLPFRSRHYLRGLSFTLSGRSVHLTVKATLSHKWAFLTE